MGNDLLFDSFAGCHVVVTGGASGIGKATAKAFASRGARVTVLDIQQEAGEETIGEIAEGGGAAQMILMDAGDPDSITQAFTGLDPIDVAVNSAGLGGLRASTHEYPLDDWQQVLAVNLTGVFLCMQQELASMAPRGSGVILNLSSIAGVRGYPGHAAYAASKHGVVGLTRSAAFEYAKQGIRINAVCPAFTETPMVMGLVQNDPDKLSRLGQRLPVGRLAQPEEVAAAMLYMASDAAAFFTGQCFIFDGGLTAI